MRIAFINRGIGMYRGGGEQFDLNIAKALQQLGCVVSFIVGKPLFEKVKYPITEFDVDYVASPYLRDLSQKLEIFGFPLRQVGYRVFHFDYMVFGKKVVKLLGKDRNRNFDVIQICGLSSLASELVDELKIPVVLRFPGPPVINQKREIEKCSAVISSGDTVNRVKNMGINNVFDISPGVDSDTFKPTANKVREKYKIQYSKLLLFVGRFAPLKNLGFLITAFKELVKERKNVKLLLLGEGPLEKQTRTWVRKLKVEEHVIFMGRLKNEQLPQYYSAADIFVMSSAYENFSNAILEAMSCELPIVATKVGGIPMQVKDGENGFLVKSDNIKQFKKAVITLLDNNSLAIEMGKRNRELVKRKYSWSTSAQKLKEVYELILK